MNWYSIKMEGFSIIYITMSMHKYFCWFEPLKLIWLDQTKFITYQDLDLNSKILQFCYRTHPFRSEFRARSPFWARPIQDGFKIVFGSWNCKIVRDPECFWAQIYSDHARRSWVEMKKAYIFNIFSFELHYLPLTTISAFHSLAIWWFLYVCLWAQFFCFLDQYCIHDLI